ncbi:MAG: hypothetical protein V1692_01320 [bacterium]
MKKVVCSLIIISSLFFFVGCVSNRSFVDSDYNNVKITGADQARRSAIASQKMRDIKEDDLYNDAMVVYYAKLKEQAGNDVSSGLPQVGFPVSFSNETGDDLFIIIEKDSTIKRQWKFDLKRGEVQYRDFFPDHYVVYAFIKANHGNTSQLHSIGKLIV